MKLTLDKRPQGLVGEFIHRRPQVPSVQLPGWDIGKTPHASGFLSSHALRRQIDAAACHSRGNAVQSCGQFVQRYKLRGLYGTQERGLWSPVRIEVSLIGSADVCHKLAEGDAAIGTAID